MSWLLILASLAKWTHCVPVRLIIIHCILNVDLKCLQLWTIYIKQLLTGYEGTCYLLLATYMYVHVLLY